MRNVGRKGRVMVMGQLRMKDENDDSESCNPLMSGTNVRGVFLSVSSS